MTVSPATFEAVLFAAIAALVLTGVWTSLAVRDAYGQLGGGELALDVSDAIAPPPLESASGQAEVQQLLDGIAAVQRYREDRGG